MFYPYQVGSVLTNFLGELQILIFDFVRYRGFPRRDPQQVKVFSGNKGIAVIHIEGYYVVASVYNLYVAVLIQAVLGGGIVQVPLKFKVFPRYLIPKSKVALFFKGAYRVRSFRYGAARLLPTDRVGSKMFLFNQNRLQGPFVQKTGAQSPGKNVNFFTACITENKMGLGRIKRSAA